MPNLTSADRARRVPIDFAISEDKVKALRAAITAEINAGKLDALLDNVQERAGVAEAARLIGLEDAVRHLEEYIERAERDAERDGRNRTAWVRHCPRWHGAPRRPAIAPCRWPNPAGSSPALA